MELELEKTLQKAIEVHKSGQIEEAERLYKVILQAQPKHPDANHNMGVLAVGVGMVQESLQFFKTALDANPNIGQYWLSCIKTLIQLGQIVDAKSVLDQAKVKGAKGEAFDQLEQRLNGLNGTQVKANPDIDAQNPVRPNVLDSLKLDQAIRLAKKKAKEGSPDESKRIYNEILARFPKNKRALDGIKLLLGGFIGKASKVQDPSQDQIQSLINLYQQGQFQRALESAKGLLSQFPNSWTLYNIQGAVNEGLGHSSAAIDSYQQSLKIKPDNADAYNNMGVALQSKGDLGAAIDSYKQAIKVKPENPGVFNNMGNALMAKGDLEAAIDSFEKALIIKPDYAEAYNNLGNALNDRDDIEGAIYNFNQALKIAPNYAEVHNNLGNTLKYKGKLASAIDSFKQAIKIKPDYADAYNNLSFPHLLQGSLKTGFNFYEWRLRKKEQPVSPARAHLIWDGEQSLSGKHFVIYEEQGLGDIIQFCRYLPLLEQKGANITFKVKPNLHALLETMDSNSRLLTSLPEENEIDFEAPLMSLPHLLSTSLETIPTTNPYLFADQKKIQTWGERVSTDRFKVGICWQGSTVKEAIGRSFPLSIFEGISRIPNVELISLHKGEGEDQMVGIDFDVITLGHDFDAGQDAFLDTAAVMMNCNLIITCDTSIAHVAGAIGRPIWLVLKQIPHWVWMLDRPDSPWYPTMTLYRQKTKGDWVEVFDTIERDLRTMLKQKKDVK